MKETELKKRPNDLQVDRNKFVVICFRIINKRLLIILFMLDLSELHSFDYD